MQLFSLNFGANALSPNPVVLGSSYNPVNPYYSPYSANSAPAVATAPSIPTTTTTYYPDAPSTSTTYILPATPSGRNVPQHVMVIKTVAFPYK